MKIRLNAVKKNKLPELHITYENNRIKQFQIVEYLGCYLEANLCGEIMAMKSLKKINESYSSSIEKMSF